jgi:hypothetical protein
LKGQKANNRKNQKKGRELVLYLVGSYFTHSTSNVAYIQIMKSNSIGRYKTSITCQSNLPFYGKG